MAPVLAKVHDHTHVQGQDVVIGKELVHNFTHGCFFLVQSLRAKVQADVDHGGLGRKTNAFLVGGGETFLPVVDVVILQHRHNFQDNVFVDLESVEVFGRIVLRANRLVRLRVGGERIESSALAKLGDVLVVLDLVFPDSPKMCDDHFLSHWARNPEVQQNVHHAEKVQGLAHELLSDVVVQYTVDCVLDEVTLLQILQEFQEVLQIPVDAVEKDVKSLDHLVDDFL